MEFSFGDSEKGGPLTLGQHRRGAFHDIISVPQCRLVHPDMRRTLAETESFFRASGLPYYSTHTHTGVLRHLVVRRSFATGDLLLNLVTTSGIAGKEALLTAFTEKLLSLPLGGRIGGILHTLNDSPADTVQGRRAAGALRRAFADRIFARPFV